MNVDKATRYHRLRRRAELAGAATTGLLLVLAVFAGLGPRLHAVVGTPPLSPLSNAFGAAWVAGVLSLALAACETPFAWYQGFALEHRYALSAQTLAHWVRDHLKAMGLAAAFTMLAASIVYGALAWSPRWWWALSAACFALASVVLVRLAPVVLLPLFYAFKPLDRPSLAARLLALAERANTSIAGVFEWSLSGHTRKANAALAGMGRTRRILLSDTLLADYSDEEIEVVLAHELAHHVHHDLWRAVALQTAALFAGFLLAHGVLGTLGARAGLADPADPGGVPLLMLTAGVWSALLTPVANGLSRMHERRADRYALEATRNAAAFVSAMRRLAQQNLAEDRPSRLVQWLFYSHPPIRERIQFAQTWRPQAQDADTNNAIPQTRSGSAPPASGEGKAMENLKIR